MGHPGVRGLEGIPDTDRDGRRSRPSALPQVYKDESVYE
jgi:hypothetical protein